MGHANAHLLRARDRALRNGDAWEVDRQELLIDASQRACTHPLRDRRIRQFTKDSPTGKYQKGHMYAVCRRCSKIVEYEP